MPTTSHLEAEPILGEESLNLPADTARPKEEGGSALALFKVGDYEGALKMWQELAKSNPDMPPAQTIMAQLYLKADMPKEAQNALDQAMVDAPDDPEAYLLLATVAMHDRDLTKADSLYQKAGRLISKFDKSVKRKKLLQSWLSRGMAGLAEARKDWTGAQKAFEEWSKLEPNNAAARQQVAYCLFQQKDAAGALEKLREAAKADPAMLTPEAVLAQFCMGTGNFEKAKKWMSAASAAAPKDLKTRLALGQCALDMGDLDQAQKHAIAATKIAPKSIEAQIAPGIDRALPEGFRGSGVDFRRGRRRVAAQRGGHQQSGPGAGGAGRCEEKSARLGACRGQREAISAMAADGFHLRIGALSAWAGRTTPKKPSAARPRLPTPTATPSTRSRAWRSTAVTRPRPSEWFRTC